jgi:hypothetical protein
MYKNTYIYVYICIYIYIYVYIQGLLLYILIDFFSVYIIQ